MLKWLLPKEDRFFALMKEQADVVLAAARLLKELLHRYEDVEEQTRKIHDLEHQGDNMALSIRNSLDSTFVTPIDREDIHGLTAMVDHVLDFIDAAAKRMIIFRLKKPTPEMIELGDILERTVLEIDQLIPKLSNLGQSEEIRVHCSEIVRLEKEADQIHHRALARLFEAEKDAIKLIKIKEVTEFLENAVDTCKDVGHVIESIVVKNG